VAQGTLLLLVQLTGERGRQSGEVALVRQLLVDYAAHLPHLLPTADYAKTFLLLRDMQVPSRVERNQATRVCFELLKHSLAGGEGGRRRD
jgi:hypothetical protein